MDIFLNVGLGMVGFLIGNLLFARVVSWLAAIHEIAKDPNGNSKAGRFASATLLSSGPWFAVAAGIFAYYIRASSWAVWIYLGAITAVAFFSVLGLYFARKANQRGRANAS
jgi:hypothetical protein